jgi:microfibrillar-associated protein 1
LSKADQQRSTVPEGLTTKKTDDPDLEGFETASESEDEAADAEEGSSEEEEESSEEEDSSSDDEPKRPMLAPKFISKAQRNKMQTTQPTKSAEDIAAEEERRRKEKADEMLQAQMERDQIARAAGKKAWNDDDNIEEEVDDTDGLDEEAERAAWKLRELKRVRRDRLAIEEKEKEREEIDRRRALTDEERKAEDEAYIAAQKDDQEGKGKMAYMQKYFHKTHVGEITHAHQWYQPGRGQLKKIHCVMHTTHNSRLDDVAHNASLETLDCGRRQISMFHKPTRHASRHMSTTVMPSHRDVCHTISPTTRASRSR